MFEVYRTYKVFDSKTHELKDAKEEFLAKVTTDEQVKLIIKNSLDKINHFVRYTQYFTYKKDSGFRIQHTGETIEDAKKD